MEVCRSTMTLVAPTQSGPKSSSPEMSKVVVVMARKRSLSRSPGSRAMDRRKLAKPPRSTSTPLGLPVEPEVKRM